MAAPAGRGALRKVFTTVASPKVSPVAYHFAMSLNTSRTGDHLFSVGSDQNGQLLQSTEAMPGDEGVDVGQRRHHAGRERLVPGPGPVRVGPHDPVRQPVQPRHLVTEQARVTP